MFPTRKIKSPSLDLELQIPCQNEQTARRREESEGEKENVTALK